MEAIGIFFMMFGVGLIVLSWRDLCRIERKAKALEQLRAHAEKYGNEWALREYDKVVKKYY